MSITIVGSLRLQAVSIIRPSLDPVNANKLVGIILMTEHFTRTISPIVGGFLADKYHKFKLIGIITYIFGEWRAKYFVPKSAKKFHACYHYLAS